MSEESIEKEKTADELMAEIEAMGQEEDIVIEKSQPSPVDEETPEAETPEATVAPEDAKEAPEVAETPEVPEATEETEDKPEDTETAEEPKPVEAEVPEDKPKHPAQLRIANRELREENERLKQAQVTPQVEQPTTQTQTTEQKADPLQVFGVLMKAENDGYANETDSKMAKNMAMEILQNDFSVQEIDSMLAQGISVFGEEGRDIAAQIQSNVRPQVAMREMQTQQEVQTSQAELQKEIQAVRIDFPDLMDADSEASKALKQWDEVNIGTVDATGRVVSRGALSAAHVKYINENPYLHATLAMGVTDSPQVQAANSELATLKKQLSEAQEKLALLESPESPSGPAGTNTGTKTTSSDDLLKRIKAMSANG